MKRIIIENISKKFFIGFRKKQSILARFISLFSGREQKKDLEVLKDISFDVNEGETMGIIGHNGSGKSTLLRIISGIYKQDSGKIILNGKLISLINLNIGLKDRLTMKENIYLCCSLFGLGREEIKRKFKLIIEFSELHDFVNTKIYQFSEGMKQRLAFSIAIHCNPEILLLDEVFEVGDEEFRKKSVTKIKELVKNKVSVILVSHDMEMIKKYCDKIILMEKGEMIQKGDTKKIVNNYLSRT
jgi:ABC-2 type transport system ATP-binding protein